MNAKRHVTKKGGEMEHSRASLEHDRAAQQHPVENRKHPVENNLKVTDIGKSERRPLSRKKWKGEDGS